MRRAPVAALFVIFVSTSCAQAAPSASNAPASAAASVAAASAAPAVSSFPPGKNVTVVLAADWATLDVHGPFNPQQGQIAMLTMDRLLALGSDGKPIPYLAKSWTSTATTATFTLRNDATCSDGTKLNATTVAGSFKRLFDPKTASPVVPRVLGPGPYSVMADDAAGTVTVTLGTAWSDMLSAFAYPSFSIICPAGLADPTKLVSRVFGSGPYTITTAVKNDSMALKRRDDWTWGAQGANAKGLPEQITIKIVPNQTTAANLLLTGGADIGIIGGPDIDRLKAEKSLLNFETQTLSVYPIFYNHAAGHPTADPLVRQAVTMVNNQKDWNQAANDGKGAVSSTFLPPGTDCYAASTKDLLPQGTPDQARALLQGAGWILVNGKLAKNGQPLKIEVLAYPGPLGKGPEYLVSQLDKIGAVAVLSMVDLPTFAARQRDGLYDVATSTQNAITSAPSYIVLSYTGPFPPSGTNYGRVENATVTDLLPKALNATGDERCKIWAQIQESLIKNNDYMPTAAPLIEHFSRGIKFSFVGTLIEPYSLRPAN